MDYRDKQFRCVAIERGFSMLEMMLVVLILTLIFGTIAAGTMRLQKRSDLEANRVDRVQETRSFMEQVARDVHQTGFPSVKMFDPAVSAANPNLYAVGLIKIDRGDLIMEGDVDGSGNVSRVEVQLLDNNNNPCPSGACVCNNATPCTLQRGSITKTNFALGQPVYYYTEVTNITNSIVFSAYDQGGVESATYPVPAANLFNIKSVGLTLSVQTAPSLEDKMPATVTMATSSKINN